LQEFNSNRRQEKHKPETLVDLDSLAGAASEGHPRYWWVKEIDDPALARRLKALPEADFELLTLYVFDGFGQAEIAGKLGVSQAAVSKKLTRLKNFLKFFDSGL
jgi:RNA polymerase sigma factor (sigma-70 family)